MNYRSILIACLATLGLAVAGRGQADGKIAFISDREGYNDVWIMNADGSAPGNLTQGRHCASPAWSPDGAKIAYIYLDDDPRGRYGGEIWLMDADGGNPQQLTDDSIDKTLLSWSADGRSIYYTVYTPPDTGDQRDGPDTFVLALDGSGSSPVEWREAPHHRRSSLSPDGTKEAFVVLRDKGDAGQPARLHISDVSEDEPSVIPLLGLPRNATVSDATWKTHSTWAPDGMRIAFTSLTHPPLIWAVDIDGGDLVELTNGLGGRNPAWQPVRGLPVVEQPTEIDLAAEVLWGSLLGTEKKNVILVRALDGIRVLISGVVEIEGTEHLYLGIDEKEFSRHDIKHLRATLEDKFPNVPIYIEASKGVTSLQDNIADEETAVSVFSDDFSANFKQWTRGLSFTAGWITDTFDDYPVPGESNGNNVALAHTNGCPGECVITTKPIDLSDYTSATLSLHRWIDDALDSGEFLAVEIGANDNYHRLATWGEESGDDVWRYNTYDIAEEYLGEQTTIRFIANIGRKSLFDSSDQEEKAVAIDNVMVQGVVPKETAPNLTIPSISVVDTDGARIRIRFSVRNDGTATASTERLVAYRHLAETDDPTTGGSRVSSGSTSRPLDVGASVTKSFSTTLPSVTSDTTFYYYVCVDAADGEEQVVDNCNYVTVTAEASIEEKPVETGKPNLVVQSVSASPTHADSNTQVSLRFSVKNIGTAPATSENIRIYRHHFQTANPTSGGTQIDTDKTSGSLATGASVTRSFSTTLPSVTSDTTFYYYICVDAADGEEQVADNCNYVTVMAEASIEEKPVSNETEEETVEDTPITDDSTEGAYRETSYPKPPYESCYHSPERKHVMAGDTMLPRPLKGKIRGRTGVYSCSTITLGGVETNDGTEGFVVSAHGVAKEWAGSALSDTTNILIGHGTYIKTFDMGRLLGKVAVMPYAREVSSDVFLIKADAAFVAYPRSLTENCSLTWKNSGKIFCLDLGSNQIERTVPLKIRGKGSDVYTVVGSQQPEVDLDVWVTGAASGVLDGNRMTSAEKLLTGNGNISWFSYAFPAATGSVKGDSGSPVYTKPDEDGNVQIVGILTGGGTFPGETVSTIFFTSWDDVADELNLKPISQ